MNKIISFVLLCVLFIMCFTGCSTLGNREDASNDNNSQSLNEGNNPSNNINESYDAGNSTDNITNDNVDYITVETKPQGDPMSQYAVSVKIPENYELSETDITISVSYGLLEGCCPNDESYTDIVLKAENEDGHNVILNTFNIEEFFKSDYTVKSIWDKNHKWIVRFDYSYTYTESYTLPLSLFSNDSGRIWIDLSEYNSAEPDGLRGESTYIYFDYIRYETYISISIESDSMHIQDG